MDPTRTLAHVVASIEAGIEHDDPFHHVELGEVFPADLYAAMLETMPEAGAYRPMSGRAKSSRHGHDADVRTKLDLFPEWIRALPREKRVVWDVVGRTLRSPQVRIALAQRLAPGLERRFGTPYSNVGLYAVPTLTRDLPGYSIGIHPDTRWKGITVQLYLPRDRSIEHVGTIFHERDREGRFREARRMPFAPNTGYAFAVGEDTWHSLERLGPEVSRRDSILLTYFVDRTPLERLHNRARRLGNLVRAGVRSALLAPDS